MQSKDLSFVVPFKGNSFEGIFFLIKTEFGLDRLHSLVEVIPCDQICSNAPKIIEPGFKQHWFSFEPNPWIKFKFNGSIKIDYYSLKTYSGDKGSGHLKSWILEGSNDDANYQKVDEVNDCEFLNSSSAEHTFQSKCTEPFRYVRLSMIGKNFAGSDFLVVRQIEFFGELSLDTV